MILILNMLQATLVGDALYFVDTLTASTRKGWKVDPATSTYAKLEVLYDFDTGADTYYKQLDIVGLAADPGVGKYGGDVTAKTVSLSGIQDAVLCC